MRLSDFKWLREKRGFFMGIGLDVKFTPAGPVAARFMASRVRVPVIMGPIGSGKTSAALLKMIILAGQQQPTKVGNEWVRKFMACAVRDTYRQLWKTTIKSWWNWVPKETGVWTGGEDQPAKHKILFRQPDNTIVDFEINFLAIGDHAVEDVLRGFEPTMFYLNEADLLSKEVYTIARGRAGRYPPMREGGPSWYGVIMDFNAPDVDNWVYELLCEEMPEGHMLFIQPSALSPHAENLDNLPPDYYADQIAGQDEWYVRRMIRNEFGFSRAGKPVFADEYNDTLHCAPEPLVPIRGIKLIIGLDAGLTPAATFWQRMPNGQWRCYYEIVVLNSESMGPNRFGELLARVLKEEFEGIEVDCAYADPSAAYGADKNDEDDFTWIQIVAKKSGIRVRAAPTNSLSPRLDAIRLPLGRMIDGEHPGLLISPRCKVLRKGFNANYRFRKVQTAGSSRFEEKPQKNDASHPMDSAQYALSGGGEHHHVMAREDKQSEHRRQTTANTDDNPEVEYSTRRSARDRAPGAL